MGNLIKGRYISWVRPCDMAAITLPLRESGDAALSSKCKWDTVPDAIDDILANWQQYWHFGAYNTGSEWYLP